MFWNKSKKQGNEIISAMTGRVAPVTDVPDPVFADKILGDGVAVLPSTGSVVAPVNGTVINVAETLHAFGLETADGLEILVHIGVNTVELKGKGFSPYVKAGDIVKAGDPLCEVDLQVVKAAGYETWTPILITNMDDIKTFAIETGNAEAGKTCVIRYEK